MTQPPRSLPVQKVLVVNGHADVLGMLETVPGAGRYDMVFVETTGRAYARVKHVRPDLVILCATFEDAAAFQLLTMLKLDPETRTIPVLTCATDGEGEAIEDAITQFADDDDDLVPLRPALPMN